MNESHTYHKQHSTSRFKDIIALGDYSRWDSGCKVEEGWIERKDMHEKKETS